MFRVGERVIKTMGVRMEGTVVPRFDWKKSNDGTYRAPLSNETPVWIEWDNKTRGWISKSFLMEGRKGSGGLGRRGATRTANGVIHVRYMGQIERGKNYRWVAGYSVFLDGNPTYPWLPKRDAIALARRIAKERGRGEGVSLGTSAEASYAKLR